MMCLATQGIFMFNEKLYKQVEGVMMEKSLWSNNSKFFPRTYRKKDIC